MGEILVWRDFGGCFCCLERDDDDNDDSNNLIYVLGLPPTQ